MTIIGVEIKLLTRA